MLSIGLNQLGIGSALSVPGVPTPPDPPVAFTPEDNGFVVFDAQDLTDGNTSSWTARGALRTVGQSNSSNQPNATSGVLAFNGSSDILFDDESSFSNPTSYDLGALVTNTGIARVPDGTFWVADHPAGDGGRTDAILRHYSADFSTQISSIDLGAVYGADVVRGVQGLVYDTSDQTLWFATSAADEIKHIGTDGVALSADDIAFTDPAGLAIDQANNRFIVLESDSAGNTLALVNKTTGATIASTEFSAQSNHDQLYFDQESRALYITAGQEYSNPASPTTIGIYHISDTASLTEMATIFLPRADSIEGIVVEDGKVWINNDAGFHNGSSGLNEVLEYDVGEITGTVIEFCGVYDIDSAAPTDAIITLNEAARNEYGMGIYPRGLDAVRSFFADSIISSNRTYEGTTSFANPRIMFWRFDTVADTVEYWIDGVSQGVTSTNSSSIADHLGPITDRGRLNIGATFGNNQDERHCDANIRAIGYAIRNTGFTDNREEFEGWAAHEYGLTGQLPSAHPYKSEAP